MGDGDQALDFLKNGKYREAGTLLDSMISKDKKDPKVWYLRALASMGAGNYRYAMECTDMSLSFVQKPEYFKLKGIIYMENFLFREALEEFSKIPENKQDEEVLFYLFVCTLFIGEPRSTEHLSAAYKKNKLKTKKMLRSFYGSIFEKSPLIGGKEKKDLKSMIEKLG